MTAMTDAEIVEIRDDHLPSQGEPFDCIAFARAIETRACAESSVQVARLRAEITVLRTANRALAETVEQLMPPKE